jgi:zinc transport system ATP-binding protein
MEKPVIEIKDLWYTFNGHPVLKEAAFDVFAGEFLALIGPNGGGKTTLLRLMLGLLEPSRGHIRVLGLTPKSASHRVGYVPQDVHINKNFPVTVKEVVRMGCLDINKNRWPRRSEKDEQTVQKALEDMDVWGLRNNRIGELSGGQRQRVFIARALATRPEILFLDEPTAGIDTGGQKRFYELMNHLNETITILLASHDMMVISSYVKSVACVNQVVHYHQGCEITDKMLDMYACPVEMIAHGLPHRVLKTHQDQ